MHADRDNNKLYYYISRATNQNKYKSKFILYSNALTQVKVEDGELVAAIEAGNTLP